MKIFTSEKQKIGEIGEKIAELFLVKQGFTVLENNFTTKYGEIDIIAKKNDKLHFIEVKTVTVSYETLFKNKSSVYIRYSKDGNHVSYVTPADMELIIKNSGKQADQQKPTVSRETFTREYRKLINPFENVSYKKIKCLLKTAQIYMSFKNLSHGTRQQLDGIGVYLGPDQTYARIEYMENLSIL